MDEADIEALERATLEALPPARLLAFQGWLVALDAGTVGRAHSAVPTRHEQVPAGLVPEIAQAYEAHGLQPAFRVPRVSGCDPVRQVLREGGYTPRQPTLTLVGAVDAFQAAPGGHDVQLTAEPPADWDEVFLGEGFDAVDAASRMAILRRGRHSLYASARWDGRIAAVGTACFSHGWCGIHGMRTASPARRRGLAGAILAAFGSEARRRGVARVFLQVEDANATARSLYERAGLRTAWCSDYWRRG